MYIHIYQDHSQMIKQNKTTLLHSCFLPKHISYDWIKINWQICVIFLKSDIYSFSKILRASLVVWWLRISLAMQGTGLQSLVWEDSACCRATKPMDHNCWACDLEPKSPNYCAHALQLLKPVFPGGCAPQQEKPPQWDAHTLQLERSPSSSEDTAQPKNK